MAHSSEFVAPGDFLTMRLPNNEAPLMRHDDGQVYGLLNVCRHRGNLVETQERGNCRAFTCPYHAWSYTTDGALRSVTFAATFGAVNPAEPRRSIDRFLDTGLPTDGSASIVDHVTMSHFVAPNVTLLRQPDHHQLLSFYPHPSDPGRCRKEMRLLVPPQGK